MPELPRPPTPRELIDIPISYSKSQSEQYHSTINRFDEESDLDLDDIVEIVKKLYRYEKKLSRLNELRAEGWKGGYKTDPQSGLRFAYVDEDLKKRSKEQETSIKKKVIQLVDELEFPGVNFDGDPRGAAIKIILPSGRSNSFGGEGWILNW